jgi:SAM-dependent methyltransferase
MLLDDDEFQMMASAAQPQLRVHEPDTKFRWLFSNFFAAQQFAGTRVIELGPGQYDFARLAAAAGATILTIDHDPAVVALGRKRGHEVILADVMTFDWNSLRGEFDGLFARWSTAPHWFSDPAPLEEFVDSICSVLKPGGWGWLFPWNRYRHTPPAHIKLMLAAQRQAFERNGFTAFEVTRLFARAGGIRDRRDLFLRGLDPGPRGLNPRRLAF